MTRHKSIKSTIQSQEQADQVLREIALLENRKTEVESWITEREQNIREQAKSKLVLNDTTSETVPDRITALSANLIAYIEEHQESFGEKKRSLDLMHGTIGYRLGTPKVSILGRMTQKAIMETEAIFKRLKSWGWIEDKPRLDKQAILSAYAVEKDKTLKRLKEVSMTVEQTDEPWFETRHVEIESAAILSEGKAAA
jgi:phage host-nuclease inhibitor protein Gam